MKHPRWKVKEIYPNQISNGIISDLSEFSVPWDSAISSQLDFGYYINSANKLVSPFVYDLVGYTPANLFEPIALTTEQRVKIAGTLYQIFNRKWSKLWAILSLEYNPIQNYDMTETEEYEGENSNVNIDTGTNTHVIDTDTTDRLTQTGTNTHVIDTDTTERLSQTGTNTHIIDTDTSQTGTVGNVGTGTTDDSIFGFNSASAVPSDSESVSSSNTRTDNLAGTEDTTDTETRNLSDSKTGTNDTTDTETRNLSDSSTGTVDTTDTETIDTRTTDNGTTSYSRSLSRSGNIGVTTSQQMITSEIELWQWNFYKQVFDDIDSILCLECY